MRRGKVNKAISELKRAIEENPASANAHNNLGLIYGKYNGRYGEARAEFRKAIGIDSRFGEARCNLAIACFLSGDEELAWKHVKVARLLGASPNQRFIGVLKSGRANGRVEAAKAVGWSPTTEVLVARRNIALIAVVVSAILVGAGIIYFSPKEIRYARIKPKSLPFRSDLIEANLSKGLFDEVISECRRAQKVHPSDPNIHNLLAQAYHGKEMWDDEIRERQKVIELNPDWPETEWAALYNNLGVAYMEKDDYDRAIKECEKAIEFWPENAEAYNNLGYAFGQKDKWDEAIEMYRRALGFKPGFREVRYNLALALAQTGSFEEAWKEVRLAEELGYPAQPLIDELKKIFPEPE